MNHSGSMHDNHSAHGHNGRDDGKRKSLNRLAASATTHCMTGCAIGEVLGLVISQALGWGTVASIAIAVALAFFFGYSLTMLPYAIARSGGSPDFWILRWTRR